MEIFVSLRSGNDIRGRDSTFRDVKSVSYNSTIYSIYMPTTTIRIPFELIQEIREKRG
jgi:hypothetical protein